ncbi:DUF2298 domain-containing protein [Blautia wexlerae]|uniref:DUF2298 domain-containing protein n=1 Tax=Blautia wexlerae TaxID=418240 RepID=UPI00189A6339|nr:DUF2298 domain-containing protein [Blautia wexlerae]
MKKVNKFKLLAAGLLIGVAFWLLGSDFFTFMIWWEILWILGLVFMPITAQIFKGFDDNGWMNSKVIAIVICGYGVWILTSIKVVHFTTLSSVVITTLCGGSSIAYGIYGKQRKVFPWKHMELVYWEEVIFFVVFLLWTYMAGFHPAAHGTEKYMDFGFMKSMMRSTTLPSEDMWYAGKAFNYYYGGQYFAVFLTKLTGTKVEITYNLMRTMIAAFAFVLPFSLVRQMLKDKLGKRGRAWITDFGGILAGLSVSMSGNLHYIIYGKIFTLLGIREDYWFPSTTRFIGFDPPVTGDETIHEFPSYSFVLGDLHAHVINVFFGNLKRYLNSTDMKPSDMRTGIKWSVVQWIELLLTAVLISLPFHLQFKSVMVQGIGIVKIHTAFYQFCVLWAFPLLICGLFVVSTLIKNRNFTNKKNRNLFYKINVSDLYGVVLSLCAMGLILIPEIIYVRDIYEKTAPRANTMFKLTYQAYILFALMMSYILVFFVADRIKILQETKLDNRYEKKVRLSKVQITVGGMAIILLISTCGYFVNATTNWFTGFPLKNKYQTLNATAYIENAIPEDAAAIRWLNKNITGQPTVLEACGDSYKDYDNRVSAMTGLPTVLGWYVHEWLWRNNLDEENKRRTDVETIYTSTDKKEVQELLDKYEVNYIFIGSCEYQKYEGVNVALLSSLGEIVFKKENTMIVKL